MSAVDDFERLLDDLVEAGVFEPAEDGALRPTPSFRRAREAGRREAAAMDGPTFDAAVADFATADGVDASAVDVATLGDAMAVHDVAGSVARERSLLAALALARVEETGALAGVPDGFVRVDGEDVDGFMASHPASVVYFWREDCDPCDGVRACFETMLAEGEIPETIGLGAVYGPASPDRFRERYQVSVAPTTLFCVDGRIDSRIVGNPGPEAFRVEVGMIAPSAE